MDLPNAAAPDSTPPDRGDDARPRAGGFFSGLLPALDFLLAVRPRRAPAPGEAGAIVRWVVPIGLVIGLAWTAVFAVAWRAYGEIGSVRVIPALAVVLLEALLTGRVLTLALARAADRVPDGQDRPLGAGGTLALLLTLLTQWVLIVSLERGTLWWPPPGDWRSFFNFMYPRQIYRPLLLAPLWGRWAMLLAASVGRTAADADATTTALCAALTPARVLRSAIVPLVLSSIYFSREQNFLIGGVIGLAVLGIAYLAAMVLSFRGGGQTRTTLFATAQLGQIAFLAVFRACWPYIRQV